MNTGKEFPWDTVPETRLYEPQALDARQETYRQIMKLLDQNILKEIPTTD